MTHFVPQFSLWYLINAIYGGCLISFVFSQNLESSAKKFNKTPVKQNGPTGKSSGSISKPQMKVGKLEWAALSSCDWLIAWLTAPLKIPHTFEPQSVSLVCLYYFEIHLLDFCRSPEPYLFDWLIRSALPPDCRQSQQVHSKWKRHELQSMENEVVLLYLLCHHLAALRNDLKCNRVECCKNWHKL